MNLKYLLFVLIRLPSTFLHELLHALFVILFAVIDRIYNLLIAVTPLPYVAPTRLLQFSIMPDEKKGRLGYVSYANASPLQSAIISLGPLLSWVLLAWLVCFTLGIALFPFTDLNISNKWGILLCVLIGPQLIWSGTLSKTDLRNAISGIVSVSTVVRLGVFYTTYVAYVYIEKYNWDTLMLIQKVKDIALECQTFFQ